MHHLQPQSESFKVAIVCCWGFPAHGKHHSGSFADERPRLCDVPVHTTYSQFRQSMAELSGLSDKPWQPGFDLLMENALDSSMPLPLSSDSHLHLLKAMCSRTDGNQGLKNVYIMPRLQDSSPSAAMTALQLECQSSSAWWIPACPQQQQPFMQLQGPQVPTRQPICSFLCQESPGKGYGFPEEAFSPRSLSAESELAGLARHILHSQPHTPRVSLKHRTRHTSSQDEGMGRPEKALFDHCWHARFGGGLSKAPSAAEHLSILSPSSNPGHLLSPPAFRPNYPIGVTEQAPVTAGESRGSPSRLHIPRGTLSWSVTPEASPTGDVIDPGHHAALLSSLQHSESAPGQLAQWDLSTGSWRAATPAVGTPSSQRPPTSMEAAQAGGPSLLAHQINIPSTEHDRRSVSLSSLARPAPVWQGQPLGACHLTSLPCPEAAQPGTAMPVPIPTRSAFAAYAVQQSFSSGSSAQSSGQAGQFGLPRRQRPTDPEASSPQHACSNVSGSQLKASPSSRLQGASLGTDLSARDSAAGLRQSRKSTGSSETHSKPQCHIPKLQPSLSDSGELWGAAMRAAAHQRGSHEDARPASVAALQVALPPTLESEEAGKVADEDVSLAKQPAVQGPRPSRLELGSRLRTGEWTSDGGWHEVSDPPLQMPLGLHQIPTGALKKLHELGRGQFGRVWLAHWKGVEVAVKELHRSGDARARAEMLQEAQTLAGLRHPCVVALFGILLDESSGNLSSVIEYVHGGSLKAGLQKLQRDINATERFRAAVALQAARGMEYLHSRHVVHFDLKCDNLLADLRSKLQPLVKIGDMGLSKYKAATFMSGNMRGTLPWMAPEMFPAMSASKSGSGQQGRLEDQVTEKVDVYSFGVCLWEIWMLGRHIHPNLSLPAIFNGAMHGTLCPELPADAPPAWSALMNACCSYQPADRPSFSDAAEHLERIVASLTAAEAESQRVTV